MGGNGGMSQPDGGLSAAAGPRPGWPTTPPEPDPLDESDPREVGPYRLVAVLGAGELGRVYLGRTLAGAAVAVKVVGRRYAADPVFRTRLEQEVATARRVQGLFTAPVVDADLQAARPWLATAYVPGPTLLQAVTEHGPLSADVAIGLVAGVAEALQSIHAAGALHRDLKPSNILLSADGPKVVDFGIARASDVTGSGSGTIAYLAPEYITGQIVTEAADVFALGAVAVFAATGRSAFGGEEHDVTSRVVHEDPDLDGCPEPLRAIAAACLAKDPGHRPGPAEIGRRCRDALTGNSDSGRPATPAPPALLPAAPAEPPGVPAAAGPAVPPPPPVPQYVPNQYGPNQYGPNQYGPNQYGQTPYAPTMSEDRRLSRRGMLIAAAGLVGVAGLVGAVAALQPDSDTASDTGSPSEPNRPPRAIGPYRLAATLQDSGRGTAGVNKPAFSPDGRVLATMIGEEVQLWDVDSRKQLAVLTGHEEYIYTLAFSPDGRLLATGSEDRTVRLWDVAGRKTRTILTGHRGRVTDVAFSPNGHLLATAADQEETARLWDVASGRQRTALTGHGGSVENVAFHPNGRLLASATLDGVLLWSLPSGRRRAVLTGHSGSVYDVAFSPDGSVLATADSGRAGGQVIFWDIAAIGQQNAVLTGFEDAVNAVAFSPDGKPPPPPATSWRCGTWPAAGNAPPSRPTTTGSMTWPLARPGCWHPVVRTPW
jgi:serine/threonine protein kinase